jgi:hypothetical protein
LVIKTLDPELNPHLQLEKMLDQDEHKINADLKPWSWHVPKVFIRSFSSVNNKQETNKPYYI